MGMFYTISDKESLRIRNNIFKDVGIPTLEKQGFIKSPFSTAWYGKNNLGDYTYELCKVTKDSLLETIVTHISKGDKWIKVYLNIFEIKPKLMSCEELKNKDGLLFHLPPNSLTKMRLRIDDYKGIPLLRTKEHKLKPFYTSNGLNKSIKELSFLIKTDMESIDDFVKRWHELHKPNVTDWEGNIISKATH